MTTTATAAELTAARTAIADAAASQPTAVLLAMLDQLVDTACGTNPALKDYMRLQFYRGVLAKLVAAANCTPKSHVFTGGVPDVDERCSCGLMAYAEATTADRFRR